VLNLEVCRPLQEPRRGFDKIVNVSKEEESDASLARIYTEPIQEELIAARVKEITDAGVPCAVSSISAARERFRGHAQEAGGGHFRGAIYGFHCAASLQRVQDARSCGFLQNTPNPRRYWQLRDLQRDAGVDAMRDAGVLIGIGPGSAARSGAGRTRSRCAAGHGNRDCAERRCDHHFKITEKYVPIITDGGMSKGGTSARRSPGGADAVMIGSEFRAQKEAPGRGFSLGNGHATCQSSSGDAHSRRFACDGYAQTNPLRPGRNSTMVPEFGGRAGDLHGDVERSQRPRVSGDGKLSSRLRSRPKASFQTVQGVGMGSK